MQKIIGVTELQRRFRLVFDEVALRHVPYVLTRGSRPVAVLISCEEYVQCRELQKTVLARFDRLLERMAAQDAVLGEEEVAADIQNACNN